MSGNDTLANLRWALEGADDDFAFEIRRDDREEGRVLTVADLRVLEADNARLREVLDHLEAEARRFAGFYHPASDGRSTFVIFADKIAALKENGQ